MKTIFAGIDAGSRAIKCVLVDESGKIIGSAIKNQGIRQEERAAKLLDEILTCHDLSRNNISKLIATGYGRDRIGFADATVTEITCHARGVRMLIPEARTVIDIGGQDSKLICMDEEGRVRDFVMNDRCAAGTGSFLEMVARKMDVSLEELGRMMPGSKNPAKISSMCVVFAETEIIGLLAKDISPEDIAAGVARSIASRIAVMAGRSVTEPIILTGGVALISGMALALEYILELKVTPSPHPQITGALGAALLAGKI